MYDRVVEPPAHLEHSLRLRRLGVDTYHEFVIYMNVRCHVCRAEGFQAQARVEVRLDNRHIIATVNVVSTTLLSDGEASLSESAWRALAAREGDRIVVTHPPPLESLRLLRAKVYGGTLAEGAWRSIIDDVVAGHYSDLHLSALVTACAGDRLDLDETIALTRAMVAVGERLLWPTAPIVDKHCVGRLPGNRTTLIIVPIVAAAGLTIPKTSSRAITSPAGTADTMGTMAPVDLDVAAMRRVVEQVGGCIVWGGNVRLSPADDILIRVERPLDFDSEGQLVASVLSKKIAAGSTHVLIDIPVGPTAKVRTAGAAAQLARRFVDAASALDLRVEVEMSDGQQPVGRGIGPALEARDVLEVLRGEATGAVDLRERALRLAGRVLELSPAVPAGTGGARAREILDSGAAWQRFLAICEAQGGFRSPPQAPLTRPVLAAHAGVCHSIDNRRLARVAKLAGAPQAPAAGVDLHVKLGDHVERGEPLFTLHAESPGERDYALRYLGSQADIIELVDR